MRGKIVVVVVVVAIDVVWGVLFTTGHYPERPEACFIFCNLVEQSGTQRQPVANVSANLWSTALFVLLHWNNSIIIITAAIMKEMENVVKLPPIK